jgi:hypothetical protein
VALHAIVLWQPFVRRDPGQVFCSSRPAKEAAFVVLLLIRSPRLGDAGDPARLLNCGCGHGVGAAPGGAAQAGERSERRADRGLERPGVSGGAVAIAKAPVPGPDLVLSNSMGYIAALEFGFSRQATAGMARVAAARFPQRRSGSTRPCGYGAAADSAIPLWPFCGPLWQGPGEV